MSYGFISKNSSGSVQISESYTNYSTFQKGSSVTGTFGRSTINYPDQGEIPSIYVQNISSSIFISISSITRTSAVIVAGYQDSYWGFVQSTNHTFNYALCTLANRIIPSGTQGLVVRRSDGSVAFDSRVPCPTITTMISKNYSFSSRTAIFSFTVPAASTHPWILLNSSGNTLLEQASDGYAEVHAVGVRSPNLSTVQLSDYISVNGYETPGVGELYIPYYSTLIARTV